MSLFKLKLRFLMRWRREREDPIGDIRSFKNRKDACQRHASSCARGLCTTRVQIGLNLFDQLGSDFFQAQLSKLHVHIGGGRTPIGVEPISEHLQHLHHDRLHPRDFRSDWRRIKEKTVQAGACNRFSDQPNNGAVQPPPVRYRR